MWFLKFDFPKVTAYAQDWGGARGGVDFKNALTPISSFLDSARISRYNVQNSKICSMCSGA